MGTETPSPALHPDVAVLAPLLGTWVGEGVGTYPTIEGFSYREEISFGHVGKPFLAYRQATRRLDTGLPAHAESGYLRGVGPTAAGTAPAAPTDVVPTAGGNVAEPTDVAGAPEGGAAVGIAVELVLAHPTGLAELAAGEAVATADGLTVHVRSTEVARTATAKEVLTTERRIVVVGDELRYEVAMGAVGQPHQHHLEATLRRRP
ncbi:MAG TPA: FABP family protein [Acidimicrobiales bacterium]|nr:FABP family protein [Acidimicrobiales bacterium]